jgi:hypothetical protein
MTFLPPSEAGQAACAGQYELFDSRRFADHIEARKLCDVCPIFTACWDNLQAVKRAPSQLGGSPEGTWAGQLYGKTEIVRPGRPPCGSERGYQSHIYFSEIACDECKEAHRLTNRIKAARTKLKKAS